MNEMKKVAQRTCASGAKSYSLPMKQEFIFAREFKFRKYFEERIRILKTFSKGNKNFESLFKRE